MGLILIGVFMVILGGALVLFRLEVGEVCFWFGVVLVAVFLLAIPISYLSVNVGIEKFESVQQSLEEARSNTNISTLETATLQLKVVEKNEWLAENKYWANHWLCNWHYPTKKLNNLEPLK